MLYCLYKNGGGWVRDKQFTICFINVCQLQHWHDMLHNKELLKIKEFKLANWFSVIQKGTEQSHGIACDLTCSSVYSIRLGAVSCHLDILINQKTRLFLQSGFCLKHNFNHFIHVKISMSSDKISWVYYILTSIWRHWLKHCRLNLPFTTATTPLKSFAFSLTFLPPYCLIIPPLLKSSTAVYLVQNLMVQFLSTLQSRSLWKLSLNLLWLTLYFPSVSNLL